MKNSLHLITKVMFDPEHYFSDRFVKIKTGDFVRNAIIVSNEGEELIVVVVQKNVSESDELKYTPVTQCISAEEVACGETELIFMDEEKINAEALDKVYVAFRETSNLLCETEHALAEKSKIKDQTDIDERNETRLSAFRKLITETKNKGA